MLFTKLTFLQAYKLNLKEALRETIYKSEENKKILMLEKREIFNILTLT